MIELLKLQNFRNIQTADITLASRLNFFVGINGSGKSSLLEAIHVLSRAKSFRASSLRSVVQHGATSFTVFAKLREQNPTQHPFSGAHRLGLAFDTHEGKSARLNGTAVKSTSDLARHLSVTYFGSESLSLLIGVPEQRRNFLDWGLFHVEQTFLPLAQRYGRALKQRNAALKQKVPESEVTIWDTEIIETGSALTTLRIAYLQQLWPLFKTSLAQMSPDIRWGNEISWRYAKGWAEGLELPASLSLSLGQDRIVGFTRHGPHRADMVMLGNGRPLRDQVSAGQTKIIVCSLLYAQAQLIKKATGLYPVLLVDDLPSELDVEHRSNVLRALATLETQFLITATERELLALDILGGDGCLFHVEHGVITQHAFIA